MNDWELERRRVAEPIVTKLKFSKDKHGNITGRYQGYEVRPCNKGKRCRYCQGEFDLSSFVGKKGPERPKVMMLPDEIIPQDNGSSFRIAHKHKSNGVAAKEKTLTIAERIGKAFLGQTPETRVTPVSVVTLGGMPFIGGSCTAYWNRDTDTILVVDYGRKVTTQDPEEKAKSRAEISRTEVPDESFLAHHKEKIRGILITHLHLDHCGALPYLPEELKDIPVFTTPLAALTIKSLCMAAELPEPEDMRVFAPGDEIEGIEGFEVISFPLIHSTPETVGFDMRPGNRRILHFGDFNMAGKNSQERERQKKLFRRLVGKGTIDLLAFDAIGAAKEGERPYGEEVFKSMEQIIVNAPGRVVVAIFASNTDCIQGTMEIAAKYGRRATPLGVAMKTSWENASQLGYIRPIISVNEVELGHLLDSSKEITFVTGGQGEPGAQLTRSAFGQERADLRLRPDDTIVFCQDPIPGNEANVARLVERLCDNSYRVITNWQDGYITHVSGHCYQGDLDEFLEPFSRHTRLFYPQHMSPVSWRVVESRYRDYNLITPRLGDHTQI